MATEINLDELINTLIDVNKSMLDRFVGLVEKLQSNLFDATTAGQLQGETEELLRTILATSSNSIGSVLTLQQQLQLNIVESFFPVQG